MTPATDAGNRVLVIMAKAARPGYVKTRLAREYPVEAVLELYRCLLSDALTLARAVPDTDIVVMAPPADLPELMPLLPGDVAAVAQQGAGLAAALTSVFASFTAAGQRRVIAFDCDSSHLPREVLDDAFGLLLTHDVVVGPTDDRGYYLVGANAAHAGLFETDHMGTEKRAREDGRRDPVGSECSEADAPARRPAGRWAAGSPRPVACAILLSRPRLRVRIPGKPLHS